MLHVLVQCTVFNDCLETVDSSRQDLGESLMAQSLECSKTELAVMASRHGHGWLTNDIESHVCASKYETIVLLRDVRSEKYQRTMARIHVCMLQMFFWLFVRFSLSTALGLREMLQQLHKILWRRGNRSSVVGDVNQDLRVTCKKIEKKQQHKMAIICG